MFDIFIKPNSLEQGIQMLNILKQHAESSAKAAPGTVGGGKTVEQIELIEAVYSEIDSQLASLIGSTVSFMIEAKDAYETVDNSAAEEFSKG